jgi:hypothetical protein
LGDSAEDITETQLISLSMAVLEVAWISIKYQRLQHFTRVQKIECGKLCKHNLVGGLEHFFHFIYGMSSFPLTNSIIFQDGYCTSNQQW